MILWIRVSTPQRAAAQEAEKKLNDKLRIKEAENSDLRHRLQQGAAGVTTDVPVLQRLKNHSMRRCALSTGGCSRKLLQGLQQGAAEL